MDYPIFYQKDGSPSKNSCLDKGQVRGGFTQEIGSAHRVSLIFIHVSRIGSGKGVANPEMGTLTNVF